MMSQSWRQMLLLVLWDILCWALIDLVTEISKLKKTTKYHYPLTRYKVLKFEFCH